MRWGQQATGGRLGRRIHRAKAIAWERGATPEQITELHQRLTDVTVKTVPLVPYLPTILSEQ